MIGRKREIRTLEDAWHSSEAELVVLYGRRRVGKTYLIRHHFADRLHFVMTGVRRARLSEQLKNFANALAEARQESVRAVPQTWQEAFTQLREHLETLPKDQRCLLFFDELPWLATSQSRFLTAFDHFWNHWAAHEKQLKVIICGSAASWMVKKVIRDQGGLHNRVTRRIHLAPFNLLESKAFLESRHVNLTPRQLLELNMVMGGIPYYLKEVRPGKSATQSIQEICFEPGGLLQNEYRHLYPALFEGSERHQEIIEALARKRYGMKRDELLSSISLKSGGTFSKLLWELEESGFVGHHQPFNKKKRDSLYFLKDEYSLFYLHWIRNRSLDFDWVQASHSPAWKSWSGLAFELICYKNLERIKKALGIEKVQTHASSWNYRPQNPDEKGAQIDLVIDRRDDCMNLCEVKFTDAPFVIDKTYAEKLRQKREVFQRLTQTKKSLFWTMITVHGLQENAWSRELVTEEIRAEAFYER